MYAYLYRNGYTHTHTHTEESRTVTDRYDEDSGWRASVRDVSVSECV